MVVERIGFSPLEGAWRGARGAVVDPDPETGLRDVPVLGTPAGYRRSDGEIGFGVDAEVTVPGHVRVGDPVVLGRD